MTQSGGRDLKRRNCRSSLGGRREAATERRPAAFGRGRVPAFGGNGYDPSKAIIARIRLAGATADDHDRLEQEVGTRLETMDGPPDGLMVHLGYEDGDDVVLVEAWRTEDLFESYYRDLLQPALGAAHLRATVAEISAALSIARP